MGYGNYPVILGTTPFYPVGVSCLLMFITLKEILLYVKRFPCESQIKTFDIGTNMAERRALSVAVPDDLMEVIEIISEQSGKSLSSSLIYLAERGVPLVVEEMKSIEVFKDLIAERKAKAKESEAEDDNKQKVRDKNGDSKK